MAELVAEKIDWARAPANTPVCEDKGIYLSDIVQAILDGYETKEEVMNSLSLVDDDEGTGEIPAILEIFVPVITAWKSGAGCGMGCEGCSGGCAG
ncbi:MAG: hypothetical protein IJU48_10485 [Synergistaceae bacterium]|nr:hypothetical protein [Synergistaceae bacterium]